MAMGGGKRLLFNKLCMLSKWPLLLLKFGFKLTNIDEKRYTNIYEKRYDCLFRRNFLKRIFVRTHRTTGG